MLTIAVILLVTLVSLIVVLWAGTFFFQGYIYTEPSAGIAWQAPLAAAILTFGFMIWLLSVAFTSSTSKTNIPINAIHRFTPNEDLLTRPAEKMWSIKAPRKTIEGAEKEGERTEYTAKVDFDGLVSRYYYKDTQTGNKWQTRDVVAVEIEVPDTANPGQPKRLRFNLTPSGVDDYKLYVGPDGWTIREWTKDGHPSGIPERFRFLRLVLNVFFNVGHLMVWFLVLCLVLRFQWLHALGFAIVMWLAVTLLVLPMMLFYAAEVAEKRQVQTSQVIVNPTP